LLHDGLRFINRVPRALQRVLFAVNLTVTERERERDAWCLLLLLLLLLLLHHLPQG